MTALETALEAEHAAVYLYGLLGGRASDIASEELVETFTDCFEAHVALRDRLITMIGDATAAPPAGAYQVPPGLGRASGLRKAAREVERVCAAALLAAVGEVADEDRRAVARALGDTAVRSLQFGTEPGPFPGRA